MDWREAELRQFLTEYNSPLVELAPVFIEVADSNGLDWRLLPALSVVESSAGKHQRNNNIFGWNSGKTRFRTVADGIRVVGKKLASLPHYRHKSLDAALKTYNPYRSYRTKVKKAMNRIHETPPQIMLVWSKPTPNNCQLRSSLLE